MFVQEMVNVQVLILVLVKLITMDRLVYSQLVLGKKEMSQVFVEDMVVVVDLMYVYASLDILEPNVKRQHVLGKKEMSQLFAMERENVFPQTLVNVIQVFADLNVTYLDVD